MLPSIILPERVTKIGIWAFSECNSLEFISIPSTNRHFFTFDGVLYSNEKKSLLCYPSGKKGETYVVPKAITQIASGAFAGCSFLNSVVLPEGLEEIYERTFSGCSSLVSITLPKSLTCIEDEAFLGCSSLGSIALPEGVTYIGSGAFQDCSSLTSVFIPQSVVYMDCPFAGCSSLGSICVSMANKRFLSMDGVLYSRDMKSILYYPAGRNDSSFTLPVGLKSIASYAFRDCRALNSITLPKSLVHIGRYVFNQYDSLVSIYSAAVNPPVVDEGAFEGVNKDIPVYVRKKSMEAYRTANGWSAFSKFCKLKNMF